MFVRHSKLLLNELRQSRLKVLCVRYLYKVKKPTYYEILNLDNSCSQKEIRNAFLTLSKVHHPDASVNGEANSKQFQTILEAYQVLSKPHSRANYDLSLKGVQTVNFVSNDTIYEPWKGSQAQSPYYGVRGINKVANWKIVFACFVFAAVGVAMQVFAIRHSITFRREQLDLSSSVNSTTHEKVREDAEKFGNSEQLERMKGRLKKSYLDVDEE